MHAYLIIAHNQFELLEKLIRALDDERNDIFIHIDAKVKDFGFAHFQQITAFSEVRFTAHRINVTWGDYSQVQTEMELFNTAVRYENPDKPYTYVHLISGVDLPIKSNDEIHRFFESHQGKEFIHHTDNEVSQLSVNRLQYYHFFRKRRNTFFKILSQLLLRVQKAMHINRLKGTALKVQKGCNWVSITGALMHHIVEQFPQYEKAFKHSYCGDETLVQTMAQSSSFAKNLYMPNCNNNHEACLRLIDWERGNPYIWRMEDYDSIVASPCMFARKFDLNVDRQIIDKILSHIK